jgi:hypothetical protein
VLFVAVLSSTAWASIFNIKVSDTVQAKLDNNFLTGVVSPRVGGVRLSLNNLIYGYSDDDINVGNDAVWIGCYLWDIENVVDNYASFCMDLTKKPNFGYTTHTAYNLPSYLEFAMESMWGTFYDEVVTDPIKAGAFQLAVWELVHETIGTLDVGSGNFYLYDLNTASPNNNGAEKEDLIEQANYYLNSENWATSKDLIMLNDGTHQPFPVVAPEPATLSLMGLCCLGLFQKRRK